MKIIAQMACVAILGISAALSGLQAQQPKGPAPVPVPPQIAAAQKVFISNVGGESFETAIDQIVLNGGPDRPYNEFYAAMKNWANLKSFHLPPTPIWSSKSVGT
jgi:hypothetical protein